MLSLQRLLARSKLMGVFQIGITGSFYLMLSTEYKNKFAEVVTVNYDLLQAAKLSNIGNNFCVLVKINATGALNISLQFSEFELSPNAILSISTDHEITDSITAKENNPKNIWATRIYQGSFLYLNLSIPKNEIGKTRLKINKVGFGFKQIGGEFFGNPGASATCNINVVCPPGNGWQNERNSVALIVSGLDEICTGNLVMNACGTNIPYLLTANHCLDADVSNWVFQFQTWSSTCTPNGTYREDVQFNGCQLRANNAATDFALVELNQIPQPNSGINYAGWTRSTTAATTSTAIHHPQGDLMKISLSHSQAVSVPWVSGASNHWRVSFSDGIVQHGSSGSALFDQNHRIVGQLHGNQNNICGNPGTNTCWCMTQRPSIGEYGRFDISWTGGGTNTTRLSNWLDPTNTGAVTTNTTNISLLTPAITGPDGICLPATSAAYTINNLPICGTNLVTWSTNVPQVTASPTTGNTTTVSANGYRGLVTLTATVSGFISPVVTKLIYIGTLPSCSTRTAYWYVNGYQTTLGKCASLTQIRCNNFNSNVLSLCEYYATAWVVDPMATSSITWSYVSSSGYTSWAPKGPKGDSVEVVINYNSPNGWLRLKCTTTNACGSYDWDFWFTPQGSTASCPVYLDINCIPIVPLTEITKATQEKVSLIPNPTNGQFVVSLKSEDKDAVIKEIIVTNKMGMPVYQQKFANKQKKQTINLFNQPTDIYLVEVFDGVKWVTEKLSLQR